MPHDKNGTKLQKGDKVLLVGTVGEIYESADMCNVSLVPDYSQSLEDNTKYPYTVTARQLIKF